MVKNRFIHFKLPFAVVHFLRLQLTVKLPESLKHITPAAFAVLQLPRSSLVLKSQSENFDSVPEQFTELMKYGILPRSLHQAMSIV